MSTKTARRVVAAGFYATLLFVSFFTASAVANPLAFITYPSAHDAYVAGLNDSGQMVGFINAGTSHPQPFVYSGGSFMLLDSSGSTASGAYGINDAGQIVGSIASGTNAGSGFFVDTGEPSQLLMCRVSLKFSLPESTTSIVGSVGINYQGQRTSLLVASTMLARS
jgi:uncharacterized membrane protein